MPITTENYMLEAFLDGDAYSALADRRRFSSIDNQFSAMTTITGDGRIDGWEIVALTFPNIRITQGSGFIDGHYVVTFNDEDFELSANGTFYAYAQRRVGISGTVGPRSDVVSVTYNDSGAPVAPSGFAVTTGASDSSFSVDLSWTANTEIDLDHYDLERSLIVSSGFSLVATIDGSDIAHTDSNDVDEDVEYFYRLYAVDQSGFRSTAATGNVTTILSAALPPNPMEVLMPHTEGAINVLWKRPVTLDFSKIANWEITHVRLDTDASTEISATQETKTVSKNSFVDRLDNLLNGEMYKITIRTVDTKGRKSDGITRNVVPQFSLAPKDPESIVSVETELVDGFVVFDFNWSEGADEYDPTVSYRNNIYVTVDGQQESLPIKVRIGQSSERVEVYTFDLSLHFSIPQNTLVTFRFTSLTQRGIESAGNYLRFITTSFGLPLPVGNLLSEFDPELGKITVTWNNQPDASDINVQVVDDDLGDEYAAAEIIDQSVGLADQFIFDASLNHIYTITVTPSDADGVDGPSDVTVELTLLSGGFAPPALPSEIFPQAGDRQIFFSWENSPSIAVVSYKIYRKTGRITTTAADWTLLDTVPKATNDFTDYGLENAQVYSYYITSVDLHEQESLHLPTGALNLNFFEVTPKPSGILTEASNVQLTLTGDDILITWESLLEEFDAFTVYRSIGNLHGWATLVSLDRNTNSYLDLDLELIDGTVFYYAVGKTINDSDISVQASNVAPESSILLGSITLGSSTFSTPDVSDRRDIKDLADPISEFTDIRVLTHKHTGLGKIAPERIDLNPELIITDWETIDGRIFTTDETNISGTSHIVKLDGRFPSVLFEIDTDTRRLVFTEPIVTVDDFGNVTGTVPEIEVRVLGIEEVQGVLDAFRFDDIHARQIGFGKLNKEQMPSINHEGRIREKLIPKTYLLERFSNHSFIVPQGNVDNTKTFGDGTTFYATIESDGLLEEVIDWDQEDNGDLVGFQLPSFASDTISNLNLYTVDEAEVTDDEFFQSEKSYFFAFEFEDSSATRWVRIATTDTPKKPNPVIDLKKRLRFKILTRDISIYVALGIREITSEDAVVGSDGGIAGPVEWVGATEVITDSLGNTAPIGKLIVASDDWQEVEFDLENENVIAFSSDANSILEGTLGVLEHFAFTIFPEQTNPTGPISVFIDKLEQIDDTLAAGTSQGILISRDFGTSWSSVRLVETPVHKFYRATNNEFIWAVATNAVLISVDPANWFETSGLTGVQYIRDIAEDEFGNMFVSTDKGVFWFEIALINNFSSWRQTQPVTAFTTDCYGMYHNVVSSGIDEIWVSTEIGIFKTTDMGQTWTDTGMNTQGLPAFEFINISSNPLIPNIIAITRKHVLRKLGSETDFSILADFEVQHNIFDIWTMEFFANHLYVSTGKGVFWNDMDELSTSGISSTTFTKIFPKLNIKGQTAIAFGLDAVVVHDSTQLFIGQENRIMMSDELNVLSIKEQFPNKELPSFFADDEEITIGYVYNAFNSVLSFREPQPVNVIYTASKLPRKFYIPLNKGWAQTNPSTDVFLYVNGIPTWLDFKLDEVAILSELQVLQSKLSPVQGTLTTFNSLVPTADTTLGLVLADITNILTGGTDGAALVNNETIIKFLEDYTRFLSLVTTSVVAANDLGVFPKFSIAGFPEISREPGSRAEALETKEIFTANDSTGINIDTLTGEIDFLTVFTTTTDPIEKQKYVFEKYDDLGITIFKSNVSNTGEFSHRELEDEMESFNTGLSSHLARAHYANLIKAGIFFETNHNFLFDRFNVTNVQSKYNSAHTNAWYDILNSTVDYDLVVKVENAAESRFANNITLFTGNTYLEDRVWVGTDNDILQYELNTSTGILALEDSVRPGNGFSSLFIWDVFVLNEDDIYVIAEEKESAVGHIFRTTTAGSTWEDLDTINLPQKLYTFSILNGNRVVGTENGIFYSDNSFGTWFPSLLTLSNRLSDTSPSVDAFALRFLNIESTTFLIAESDRWFYTSNAGIEWFGLGGQATSNGLSVINKIQRFKNLTWIGTDKGLYNDGNSVLSDGVQFGLQNDLESSSTASSNLKINDIVAGTDALYCAAGQKIYKFFNNTWTSHTVPNVSTIHKIGIRETSTKRWMIVVAHNQIVTVDVTSGTGVFG